MNHDRAISIFEEIRARPYRVSEELGVAANNCYFKGIELLQRLGTLGYSVRGCVGDTYWDTNLIPAEIVAMEAKEFQGTHFWVEAEIEGQWRTLDASFQPELTRHGFTIGEWDNGKTCFPITKLYTLEEQIAYYVKWSDPAKGAEYFEKNGPFLKRLNEWFAQLA